MNTLINMPVDEMVQKKLLIFISEINVLIYYSMRILIKELRAFQFLPYWDILTNLVVEISLYL